MPQTDAVSGAGDAFRLILTSGLQSSSARAERRQE
jgi:hypothetical protein